MMKKKNRNTFESIEFELKTSKKFYSEDYLLILSVILFLFYLIGATIDVYFLPLKIGLLRILGFSSLLIFIGWAILNGLFGKQRIIGKLKFTKSNVLIVESGEEFYINIKEAEKIEIIFKYHFGELRNLWGMFHFESSNNNQLIIMYHGQEFNYFFISRDSDDKKWLLNLVNCWRTNGINCNFIGA